MCLVAGSLKTPKKTAGFGWKVVKRVNKQLYTPHWDRRLRTNVWSKALPTTIYTAPLRSSENYISGFHIFKTKSAAEKYLREWSMVLEVVKVEYRGAHTEGLDGEKDNLPVIVAREMRILPPSEVS